VGLDSWPLVVASPHVALRTGRSGLKPASCRHDRQRPTGCGLARRRGAGALPRRQNP